VLRLARNGKLGIFIALVMAASMWFYVQRVMIGHQLDLAARRGIPRGNLSDLYPRWLGARELLLHHRDPYSTDVTREIQAGYYGRPLDAGRPNDPKDQAAFAYPVYVAFLLAPTLGLPFEIVRLGFGWFLVILTGVSVWLWFGILNWRAKPTVVTIAICLTLGSFQVIQGIKLQQLSLLVAGLIAVSAWLVAEDRFTLAGALLGLATIKPQLVLPFLAWLMIWAAGDWARRKKLILAFGVTMILLLAASEIILPGWFRRFLDAVSAYRAYNAGAESILSTFLSSRLGGALTWLILLALAAFAWRIRRAEANHAEFRFMTVLVLSVTLLIIPTASPYNQVLLLPGILFAAQHWQAFYQKSRFSRTAMFTTIAIVAWPWLAAIGLTVASLVLPAESVQREWAWPIYTNLAIPLGVVTLLASGVGEFTSQVAHKQPVLA